MRCAAWMLLAGLAAAASGCAGGDAEHAARGEPGSVLVEGCPVAGVEARCVMLQAADGQLYNITAADPQPALDGRAIRLTATAQQRHGFLHAGHQAGRHRLVLHRRHLPALRRSQAWLKPS